MAELKTKPTRASVAAFLSAIPDAEARKDCKAISAMLRKATGKKPEMWGTSIVGFGRMTYYGRSGSSEWMEVAFSPRKAAITLYLTMGLTGSDALLKKLGRHTRGGGCLYIKRLADVDTTVLNRLVVETVKRVRAYARTHA